MKSLSKNELFKINGGRYMIAAPTNFLFMKFLKWLGKVLK